MKRAAKRQLAIKKKHHLGKKEASASAIALRVNSLAYCRTKLTC